MAVTVFDSVFVFRMSFRNFTTGNSHYFGGKYLELVPNERVRYTDVFEDPYLPGEMQVTVTLKAVSVGTDMTAVQEGIPDLIPQGRLVLGVLTIIGMIKAVGHIIDAVTDPLIAAGSDKSRHKDGRCG